MTGMMQTWVEPPEVLMRIVEIKVYHSPWRRDVLSRSRSGAYTSYCRGLPTDSATHTALFHLKRLDPHIKLKRSLQVVAWRGRAAVDGGFPRNGHHDLNHGSHSDHLCPSTRYLTLTESKQLGSHSDLSSVYLL